jgi:hypothetical protein
VLAKRNAPSQVQSELQIIKFAFQRDCERLQYLNFGLKSLPSYLLPIFSILSVNANLIRDLTNKYKQKADTQKTAIAQL